MRLVPRLAVVLTTVLACVGCDQATKSAAQAHLAHGPIVSLLGDTLRLQYAENSGAFLSMGAGLPDAVRHAIFIGGVAVILLVVLVAALLMRRLPASRLFALALICGGGLGNLADRIARDGRVIDFLNVGVGPLRSGIFNVADVALVVGVAMMMLGGDGARRVTPPRDAAPPPASPPTAPG